MKERGLNMMLRAIAILKDRIDRLKFILIGDARKEDAAYLDSAIRNLGLEHQIDFLGRLDHRDVLTHMEVSDVCLFPFPRAETVNYIYPVKIFEYMAMGKAIVATRLVGIRCIIRDGVDGLLVEPNDAEEMAHAIFRIYKDSDLRKRLETSARGAAKEYDWTKINEEINEKLVRL
jgi:glycosyltransferase involved in cell wall biosynthesis